MIKTCGEGADSAVDSEDDPGDSCLMLVMMRVTSAIVHMMEENRIEYEIAAHDVAVGSSSDDAYKLIALGRGYT
jgi:hypothetical protein